MSYKSFAKCCVRVLLRVLMTSLVVPIILPPRSQCLLNSYDSSNSERYRVGKKNFYSLKVAPLTALSLGISYLIKVPSPVCNIDWIRQSFVEQCSI